MIRKLGIVFITKGAWLAVKVVDYVYISNCNMCSANLQGHAFYFRFIISYPIKQYRFTIHPYQMNHAKIIWHLCLYYIYIVE